MPGVPALPAIGDCSWNLGGAARDVETAYADWRRHDNVRRLWDGDASLWTGADEGRWLGWLHILDRRRELVAALYAVVQGTAAYRHAVLLGMGGSSLCPEVLRRTFGPVAKHPELVVLDSTSPDQVRSVARRIDPARTLFVVSSKSGTTTETNVFCEYFLAQARAAGVDSPASHFMAITDPGSKLETWATQTGFRAVLHGVPEIGGRYSALSNFGMAPGAIAGVNVGDMLERAAAMARACGPDVPPEANPAVALGVVLGVLARAGRDKLTLVLSSEIASLGAWLEQLMAESTGKNGMGIVPIDGEALGAPEVYGDDRVFVCTRLRGSADAAMEAALRALEAAGQPVVRITLADRLDLGQEFFRWEMATAAAGAVLGIHPFDQPDVEASKVATRRLTAAYEKEGRAPAEEPMWSGDGVAVFADPRNAETLRPPVPSFESFLQAHLQRLGRGDTFTLQAYLEMNAENERRLQEVRHLVRDARRVATTLGFGPRFLHSTGQLHKGGSDAGIFLQLTAEPSQDLPIPGRAYSFGLLQRFQSEGDLAVLAARGRRVLRLHLGTDVAGNLERLRDCVEKLGA